MYTAEIGEQILFMITIFNFVSKKLYEDTEQKTKLELLRN